MSALGRAEICGFPYTEGAPQGSDVPTVDASQGNAYHGSYACVVNHGMGTGPAHIVDAQCKRYGLDPEKYRAHVMDLDPIGGANRLAQAHPTVRAEVAVAYNPETGTAVELGVELERAYPEDPALICGTVDLVWTEADPVSGDLTLVIRDHKAGFRSEATVTPAAQNLQLGALAVAFSKFVDCEQVRVELAFPKSGGDEVIDTHTYSLFDLMEVEDRILAIVSAIKAGSEPKPGIHCVQAYCPLRLQCPATTQALEAMVPATVAQAEAPDGWPSVVTSADQIQGPRHCAWILHRAKAVEAAVKIQIDACKRYTDKNGPVPMGDGEQWGPTITQPNEVIEGDVDGLRACLATHLSPEAIATLVKAKVGKGELGKACKLAAPPRKGGKLEETVLEALRSANYAKREGLSKITYCVHAAPAAQLPAKKDAAA